MSRHARWAAFLAALVVCVGVLGWLRFRTPKIGRHSYRIGWMISPPFQVRGADGRPAGLSVDLVNEAARRRGITLQWLFWPDSSESALETKQVDLWPLITITPERLKSFHITEPYLQHEHCLLVRDDSAYQTVEDLAAGTVGITNVSIDLVHLRSILPHAIPVSYPDFGAAVEATCNGRNEAVFADRYTAIAGLLEIPECGDHTLRWIAVPQVRSQLGVGSTFEARAVADAIREEIGAMGREGRLAAIFGRWGFMAGQDVESVEALVNARRRETRLITATGLFAFLFGLTCWQTLRLMRERNRTRRVEAALHESQFRSMQAQKMESIGRLAGGIAHDFNNLLTVINGYADIVFKKLADTHPLRPSIDEIRQAGKQAAELTQQLLVFSRKNVIQPRPLSLNTLLQESENMFRRLLGEEIEFVTLLSAEPGMVMADRSQLQQVLMNLVINARDAMPNGGRLVIETAVESHEQNGGRPRDAADGPTILLTVSDTGSGMDEETKEHIFEPFFTTKGPGRGTGLGLATVYGIVQQSGGWISVQSERGRGSSFQIHLPCITGSAVEDPSADSAEPPRLGSETILVVEDQTEVRTFAVNALSAHGYRVLDASDGAQALELSGRHSGMIDLLLTDVVMPGMNGRELADRLKADRPNLSVLFTSGYTEDVIVKRGVMDSNIAFLPKPYTAGDLVARIREILHRDG